MDVDLAADAREIQTLLTDSANLYFQNRQVAPADHPPVQRVELAFLLGTPQPPVVSVDFDARPDTEEDGDASHRCFAQWHCPAWAKFLSPGDEVIRFTFADGSVHEADSDSLDQTVGAFLAGVLRDASAGGTFNAIKGHGELILTVTYEGFPVEMSPAATPLL